VQEIRSTEESGYKCSSRVAIAATSAQSLRALQDLARRALCVCGRAKTVGGSVAWVTMGHTCPARRNDRPLRRIRAALGAARAATIGDRNCDGCHSVSFLRGIERRGKRLCSAGGRLVQRDHVPNDFHADAGTIAGGDRGDLGLSLPVDRRRCVHSASRRRVRRCQRVSRFLPFSSYLLCPFMRVCSTRGAHTGVR